VVNQVLIQNDKRRIICCVYDDVKTYIVLRNAFRSSNLNNGTGFENSAIVSENLILDACMMNVVKTVLQTFV
jgi:hypothetical protein